jgi:tetratricopeptide (TPR) repeat protein
MNNYGAKYMEKRQYGKAISAFSKALKSTKYIVADHEDVDERCSEDSGLEWCLKHQKRQALFLFDSSEGFEKNNCCGDFFVHAQPISIAEKTPTVMSHSCIASTVMFNLALAHHIKAFSSRRGGQQSRSQEQDLYKARKLYVLCHNMLSDEPVMDAGVLFMSMLIVNNVGQINIMLKIHDEARRCFEQLLSLQMLLLDCEDETTWVNLDGIVHNTSLLILTGSSVAAAA